MSFHDVAPPKRAISTHPRPTGQGVAGRQPRLATERHDHDQRMEAGCGPGGGYGGPDRGRGRRYGRHRLGRAAAPPGAQGVAPLRRGAGPLDAGLAPGVPGPAPPRVRRPLEPRLATGPPGVPPPLTPSAAGRSGGDFTGPGTPRSAATRAGSCRRTALPTRGRLTLITRRPMRRTTMAGRSPAVDAGIPASRWRWR